MGRAIDVDNRLDDQERRIKLLEGAVEDLIQHNTTTHHVDLNKELEKHEEKIREENKVVEPTETYKAPKKTTTKKSTAKVG